MNIYNLDHCKRRNWMLHRGIIRHNPAYQHIRDEIRKIEEREIELRVDEYIRTPAKGLAPGLEGSIHLVVLEGEKYLLATSHGMSKALKKLLSFITKIDKWYVVSFYGDHFDYGSDYSIEVHLEDPEDIDTSYICDVEPPPPVTYPTCKTCPGHTFCYGEDRDRKYRLSQNKTCRTCQHVRFDTNSPTVACNKHRQALTLDIQVKGCNDHEVFWL